MKFEWDESKNISNIEKHGIDFNDALFDDDNRLEAVDRRRDYGEERL